MADLIIFSSVIIGIIIIVLITKSAKKVVDVTVDKVKETSSDYLQNSKDDKMLKAKELFDKKIIDKAEYDDRILKLKKNS